MKMYQYLKITEKSEKSVFFLKLPFKRQLKILIFSKDVLSV